MDGAVKDSGVVAEQKPYNPFNLDKEIKRSHSFQEVKTAAEKRRVFVDERQILTRAREKGKLSLEMGAEVATTVRGILYGSLDTTGDFGQQDNFDGKLRELAGKENGGDEEESQYLWQRFALAAGELRATQKGLGLDSVASQEERDARMVFVKILQEVAKQGPAKFVLHFWENGDLKWLWGVDKEETFVQVSMKNLGGRVADLAEYYQAGAVSRAW